MKKFRVPLAVIICIATAALARAGQAEDEAAIRKNVDAYVTAYNNHDAKTLASFWSPDAVYLNPLTGEEVVGHDAVANQFAAILAKLGDAKLVVNVKSIEFISPNVAVEHGTTQVIKKSEKNPGTTDYTAVHVKRDGKWLLDRVSEEDSPVAISNYDHLKDLEWMIGSWVDEDDNSRVEMSCKWTTNQTFIARTFSVSAGDRLDMDGIQFIGWDPSVGKIRSWVFDSDGGFGEATWAKKNNRWIISADAIMPDGRKTSAINTMTILDKNSFTWQSSGRDLDGELLPNIDPIKIVRQPASDVTKTSDAR